MFTIEIPELEYEVVTEVTERIKIGEEVYNKDGALVTVADVKRGPKWTTLVGAGDGKLRRRKKIQPKRGLLFRCRCRRAGNAASVRGFAGR